jgi:hypothetical protein
MQAEWKGGRILLGDNKVGAAFGLRPVNFRCVRLGVLDGFTCKSLCAPYDYSTKKHATYFIQFQSPNMIK